MLTSGNIKIDWMMLFFLNIYASHEFLSLHITLFNSLCLTIFFSVLRIKIFSLLIVYI